ncbi:MAG TPA: hypothetical protein VHP33_28065 [Polyangiaceae bacterium]|nr:hypothetical protein [Polyangiaceae bacterium]
MAELAGPALKQITAAHLAAVQQQALGQGSWPVGFDASSPQFRAHGGKTAIGALLLNLVHVYHPEVDHPEVDRNTPSRELAEHFADFVRMAAGSAPFEEVDEAAVRAKMLELCPKGPTNDLEADAVRVGEALGMSRKDARNAVSQAASDFDRK